MKEVCLRLFGLFGFDFIEELVVDLIEVGSL
jgi:hypothetical protein